MQNVGKRWQQSGTKITSEVIRERINHGLEMNRLARIAEDEAMAQHMAPAVARQHIVAARMEYASANGFIGDSQRNDYWVIANKFGDIIDDACLILWESLRKLKNNRTEAEYARNVVRLMAHDVKHPGCPNALRNKIDVAEEYSAQSSAQKDDVAIRLMELEAELGLPTEQVIDSGQRILHERTLAFTENISTKEEEVSTPMQQMYTMDELLAAMRESFKGMIPPQTNYDKDELLAAMRESFKDMIPPQVELEPVLQAIQALELRQQYENALHVIHQAFNEHKETFSSLIEEKERIIANLQEQRDRLDRTVAKLEKDNDHLSSLGEIGEAEKQELTAEYAELRTNYEILRKDNLAMREQAAMLKSHVETLRLNQEMVPAMLKIYEDQAFLLRSENTLLSQKLENAQNETKQQITSKLLSALD